MSVHEFPKKDDDCQCPICEIFDMYFDDMLSADSPEELEYIVRDLIDHSIKTGIIDAIEQDIDNKIRFLETVDLDEE